MIPTQCGYNNVNIHRKDVFLGPTLVSHPPISCHTPCATMLRIPISYSMMSLTMLSTIINIEKDIHCDCLLALILVNQAMVSLPKMAKCGHIFWREIG